MDNEPFVANDGGRWFIMLNVDHQDAEGYWGMSTEYLMNPNGYDSEDEANDALDIYLLKGN